MLHTNSDIFVTRCIVLAGGRGTRLGKLTESTPKPLLSVGGRPFLEYLVWNLRRWGIKDIVLSVGYYGEQIEQHFRDGAQWGVNITYAHEDTPLGTGGAVRFAASKFTDSFFVINGDTLLDVHFAALSTLVQQHGAMAGIALRNVEDAGRYGAISIKKDHIFGFHEKQSASPGLINGGVYLLTPDAVALLPEGVSSIETDLFPRLALRGALVGSECGGFFLDIGLPDTYSLSQNLLPKWQSMVSRPTVILDRDGTIIVEKNYLHDVERVELLPMAVEGLKLLHEKNFRIFIVTNQSGIERGYFKEDDMHAVNRRVQDLLAKHGITIDAIYFCPHAPDAGCSCRKPNQGLIERLWSEHGLVTECAYVVGDKACDIELGERAQMRTLLVRTGYGKAEEAKPEFRPSAVVDDLLGAAQWMLTSQKKITSKAEA